VFFVANDDARTWKEVWDEWRLSDIIEYAAHKNVWEQEKNERLHDALSDITDPIAALLTILLHK
jgi:hypothetical protein